MTTPAQIAVLLDLHPISPSPFISNHTDLLRNQINNVRINDQTSCDVIHLYVLTSSQNHVSKTVDKLTPIEGQTHVTVVEAEDRIASFYSAKQKLDNLDITKVRLVCDAYTEKFWTHVCELLFTPVHEWNVEVVKSPSRSDGDEAEESLYLPPAQTEAETPTISTYRSASENYHLNTTRPQHNISSSTDSEISDCTSDSVRTRIQRFLKTLPSLLGLPEVERSSLLPGEGAGFVHGYSTRRGGVTLVPAMCAMNLLYTDKKRDSRLVVDENRRRLSLVGGFDPDSYHIVRVEHGHHVWTVGEELPLKYDALITNKRDVTIAAAGADCIALLFADPVAMVIGAAHAGWLGTVERVAECVVKAMGAKFGSRPEDIRVSMGPGLRLGCFQVLLQEGRMFSEIHPSCETEIVEPVSHKIDKTALKKKDPHSWKGPGKCLQDEDLQHQGVQGPVNSETLKADNTADGRDLTAAEKSFKTTDASKKNRETISCYLRANDIGHMQDTDSAASLSKLSREDFKVQLIPADQLESRTPKRRKSTSLKWTFVDLQMTNYHVLLQSGVKAEHIDMSTSHCTKCNPDLYFSYERDGFPFGNQIGFICMPSGPSA